MHQFRYLDGDLHCEDVSLSNIADQVGTPTYVYSANTIRENYRRLDRAFSEIDHRICYALKANSNLAVLNLLAAEGADFDIVSGGELFRVLESGGRADRCTFAGVGKTRAEIEYALDCGIHSFNVEGEEELTQINSIAAERKTRAPIALRVNPDVEANTHKYISTGKSRNKFGIGIDRIDEVYRAAAKLENIEIRGIQTHIGSQILDTTPFAEAIAKLIPVVQEIQADHDIEFFSIGGGIGIVYEDSLASGNPDWWQSADQPRRITPEAYAAAVVPLLKPLNLTIFLEPGRFLVGNAGALVTSVVSVKNTRAKHFTIVDAGMNDLIRPALYEGHHDIHPVKEPTAEPIVTDVVGPVCESGDFFAQDRSLPPSVSGDRLALLSAGAYGFVMASNYNSRPFPPEVLVDGDQSHVIRVRQTYEDLIRGESIPPEV
ncbi:MAG: diaminopimelate decarboxylase [Chthoniobacterales bacterium]